MKAKKTDRIFKKSSFTNAPKPYPTCVEVSISNDDVLIRNSSSLNQGTIKYTLEEWDAFIKGVKNGEFDLK
jgi:hypothetical protein